MKIVVLNGSPKGMTSVTIQYVRFLAKTYPEHDFKILHVSRDLRRLEDDAGAFDGVVRAVEGADGVIWAFPLYYLLVHAHYKRFIELVFERGAGEAFRGKHAAALSTSIRFFDRGFFNNHVPILVGKQVGLLVSGPLMQIANLRQLLVCRMPTREPGGDRHR